MKDTGLPLIWAWLLRRGSSANSTEVLKSEAESSSKFRTAKFSGSSGIRGRRAWLFLFKALFSLVTWEFISHMTKTVVQYCSSTAYIHPLKALQNNINILDCAMQYKMVFLYLLPILVRNQEMNQLKLINVLMRKAMLFIMNCQCVNESYALSLQSMVCTNPFLTVSKCIYKERS